MLNAIDRTIRKDNIIIDTIQVPCMNWYGKYETAISFDNQKTWNIAQGYETKKQAQTGHKKYVKMSEKQLNKINWLD